MADFGSWNYSAWNYSARKVILHSDECGRCEQMTGCPIISRGAGQCPRTGGGFQGIMLPGNHNGHRSSPPNTSEMAVSRGSTQLQGKTATGKTATDEPHRWVKRTGGAARFVVGAAVVAVDRGWTLLALHPIGNALTDGHGGGVSVGADDVRHYGRVGHT